MTPKNTDATTLRLVAGFATSHQQRRLAKALADEPSRRLAQHGALCAQLAEAEGARRAELAKRTDAAWAAVLALPYEADYAPGSPTARAAPEEAEAEKLARLESLVWDWENGQSWTPY